MIYNTNSFLQHDSFGCQLPRANTNMICLVIGRMSGDISSVGDTIIDIKYVAGFWISLVRTDIDIFWASEL